MKLTVIGCSGSFPGPDSPASCYLVESFHEGRPWRILLDLGSGALGALQRYADPLSIDAVFLSHLHPDHCADLSGFHVLRKYHPTGSKPRIPVYGPVDTAVRLADAYGLPHDPGMSEEFDVRSYDGTITFGPFEVTPVPVVHPVPAFALKVSAEGRTLVYSGDTGPCESLTAAAQGADLLLAEAAFLASADNPPDVHLTGLDCAAIATAAGVDRLVLTHIPPWHSRDVVLAEASSAFSGELGVAVVGATYDV